MDEYAVQTLISTNYESLPRRLDVSAFANLLITFDMLQIKSDRIREELEEYPGTTGNPDIFCTLQISQIASRLHYSQLLTNIFRRCCMLGVYRQSVRDLTVPNAFLSNQLEVLSVIDVNQLIEIVGSYNCCDKQNEAGEQTFYKILTDMGRHPHVRHSAVVDKIFRVVNLPEEANLSSDWLPRAHYTLIGEFLIV
jgi:hypothetical protein